MTGDRLRIGLIGHRFMGKMHSHAYRVMAQMMSPALIPELVVICGRDAASCEVARSAWGWSEIATDWQDVVCRSDIDAVDIAAPSNVHAAIAMAALGNGKHVFVEKPLANSVADAEQMWQEAQGSGTVHMVGFNYRWLPAIQLARDLIANGRLGCIYHVRAQYLQDWAMDPCVPLSWRFQKPIAGSGALGDLLSHAIDLVRFLVDEFAEISGVQSTFVKRRPTVQAPIGTGIGSAVAADAMAPVTVDDATLAIGQLQGGTLVSLEATRFASGRKNALHLEINGSKGSIVWDLENLNDLLVHLRESSVPALEGYRRVLATHANHPYMEYWWPEGHSVGYDVSFVHELHAWVTAIGSPEGLSIPNFYDGFRCQQVIEAITASALDGKRIAINVAPTPPAEGSVQNPLTAP